MLRHHRSEQDHCVSSVKQELCRLPPGYPTPRVSPKVFGTEGVTQEPDIGVNSFEDDGVATRNVIDHDYLDSVSPAGPHETQWLFGWCVLSMMRFIE